MEKLQEILSEIQRRCVYTRQCSCLLTAPSRVRVSVENSWGAAEHLLHLQYKVWLSRVESLCLRQAWSSLLGDCLSYCLMFFSRHGETHFTEPLSFYWFMSFPEISDSFDRLTVPTFIHVQLIKHQSPVPRLNTLWTSQGWPSTPVCTQARMWVVWFLFK